MREGELHILSCLRKCISFFLSQSNSVDIFLFSVFDSLVQRKLTPHVAWRVTFVIVPFVVVMTLAISILLLAPDTPTGPWKDRHLKRITKEKEDINSVKSDEDKNTRFPLSKEVSDDIQGLGKITQSHDGTVDDCEAIQSAQADLIKKPSMTDVIIVFCSLPTLTLCSLYFVTFGAELSINSNLSTFYIKSSGTSPWPQTLAANWAAMYGVLNVLIRPLGGFIADCLYPVAGIEGKKYWTITCIYTSPYMQTLNYEGGFIQGIVLTTIGFIPNINIYSLIGAVAVSSVFTEAGNGANFAVVPHVHPSHNGIVSGFTGAAGNFGGIVFALVFRFNGTDYHKSYWIIGILSMAMSLIVSVVRFPKVILLILLPFQVSDQLVNFLAPR